MEPIRAGIGLTGSFCTFADVFASLEQLKQTCPGIDYTFVLSYNTQQLSTRFGSPQDTFTRLGGLSDKAPITTIGDAEPLGPRSLLDVFVIAPCTGNTLAKLANGVTDTAVF